MSTDLCFVDIARTFPEFADPHHLLRAVQGGSFPPPDRSIGATPFWSAAAVTGYIDGRATVEAAAGEDKVLVNYIRGHLEGGEAS